MSQPKRGIFPTCCASTACAVTRRLRASAATKATSVRAMIAASFPLGRPLAEGGERLLDHFIRPREQRRGNRQTERLGGLEVDDELELLGPLDRHIPGLGSVQDLPDDDSRAAEALAHARSIREQAPGLRELTEERDGREP